jgi:hypothetical protein
MHVLHWWAVRAENKEDAVGIVSSALSDNFAEWSDWHVVGGGRWSESQYDNSSDMVISYAEEPIKFKETISSCLDARREEMKYLKDKIDIEAFTNRVETYANSGNIGKEKFDLNEYYIRKASTLLQDYYDCDSYFYDYVEYTASSDYIYDKLDREDSNTLFLVPIDFHF